MTLGTIVLTPFPFTDLTSNKLRPAVIISPVIPNDTDVIVAFISSMMSSHTSVCDYVLSDTHQDFRLSGLKKTSVFKMNKLATLDKHIFVGQIGEVSPNILKDLQAKLKIALDLI